MDLELSVGSSSGTERAEELVDTQQRGQRYPSGSDRRLEDVSDPHRRPDESASGLVEWIAEHHWYALIVGLFGLVIVAIGISILAQLAPAWLKNIWVRRVLVVGPLVGGAYVAGRRQQYAAYRDMDTLTLRMPDGVRRYHGTLESAASDDRLVFTPIKGWSWLGNPGAAYSLGELSDDLPLDTSPANVDDDDPVRIGLHPAFAAAARTHTGTAAVQLTSGLQTYPWGQSFNVRARIPDTAEESRLTDLREELERTTSEVQNLRERADQLQRQRDNAREMARQSFDETIAMFSEQVNRISDAFDTDRDRNDDESDGLDDIALEEEFSYED